MDFNTSHNTDKAKFNILLEQADPSYICDIAIKCGKVILKQLNGIVSGKYRFNGLLFPQFFQIRDQALLRHNIRCIQRIHLKKAVCLRPLMFNCAAAANTLIMSVQIVK